MTATEETFCIAREDRMCVSVHKESGTAIPLVLGTYEKHAFYMRIKALSF
jgi:hypothetical protein